jgi:hypothetical protein
MPCRHHNFVDLASITARFSPDRTHRYTLNIPILNRPDGKPLIVIGQNPSEATETQADRTIRFLERLVFHGLPAYNRIHMLNLYTRMDKHKKFSDVLDERSDQELKESITSGSDVLLIFGRPRTEGSYRFADRVRQIAPLLAGVNLFKLAIGTDYPPHPGNLLIRYRSSGAKVEACVYTDTW